MKDGPVILFDGVCNLCNSSVNWIIDRDTKNVFRFSSLQSPFGQKLRSKLPENQKSADSIFLWEAGHIYIKSTAALRIAKTIGGIYYLLYGFIIVPAFIRDYIYDIIARNRYNWFGKKEQCRVPTPDLKERFIES